MTTATGNIALTLYNLETLLASSATFRAAVGAADVAAARSSIYWLADEPAANVTTFAWIKQKEGWKAENQGGMANYWLSMPLQILFQRADVEADGAKEKQIKFLNALGSIIAEMLALAGTGSYLQVSNLTVTNTVMSDPNDEQHPYQQALLDVQVF